MSYQHPYQTYQPGYYPPPPPRQSSGSSYAAEQVPPLPPRPSPSPGSPDVQGLTSGFERLSTYEQPPAQQPYVPHAEYHQAKSIPYTYPTDHGASVNPMSPVQYTSPPPLPPRRESQSSWQTSQSPPLSSYPAPQQWQQPPPQSPWTAPQTQPNMHPPIPQWQQGGTYNRPPPPPPPGLLKAQTPTQPAGHQPPSPFLQHHQHGYQHMASPPLVSPADSWSQRTSTSSPSQYSQSQFSYQKPPPPQISQSPAPLPYYPPPQDNSTPPSNQATSPPVQAESETILELEAVHKPIGTQESSRPEPPPAQFLFEMEGSIPGVPDQQKHKAEPPKEKVNITPNPGKLQRTFTDTLRQAGPYYYTPPSPVADVKEEVEIVNDVGSKGVKSKSSEVAPETSVAGMSTEAGVIHASDAEQKESADLSNSAGNTETVPGTDKIPDDRESRPYSYTTTQTMDFNPKPDTIPDERVSRPYSYTPTQTNDSKPKPDNGTQTSPASGFPRPPNIEVQLPLAGAEPSCYYLKIPNPPANLPADQASNYFVPHKCDYPEKMLFADVWWFTHIDVPDFRICGYCFEKHIRYTDFSSSFAGRIESKDLKLQCSFGAPRALEQLWPQAVRTKDLSPFKGYMERRVRIPDCRGVAGVTGKDASGVRWFKMRNNDVPQFLICEACLEEQAVGGIFENQYTPYLEQQGQNQTWSCDMALAYLRRSFAQAVKMADWGVFSRAAARRLALPQCEGVKGVKAGSRQWYTPAKPIEGVVICEACYDDFFAFSEFEHEFVERPVQKVGFNDLWSCDLSAIGVKNAVDVIRMNHDFTPMRTVLGTLAVTPPCAAGPISSTTWYNLASNSENFDICPTCYAGLFAILGLSHLCRPTTSAQPSERVCDFSNHSPRFMQYITRWIAAVNSPTALPDLLNYISHFAAQPPCAGTAAAQNRQWYLLNGAAADLVACTDCHAAAIATTPLAHLLTPTAARDPLPRVCDMYSANMRTRWQQLCADPSAASLDAFVAHSRHRHRVYAETVPRCRELVALARVRAEQHSLANTMSSHYSFMNGITAPSSRITYSAAPLYTYSYGGYETPYGAQAAAAGAAGVNLLMEQMGDTQKVAMLEARWKEVE